MQKAVNDVNDIFTSEVMENVTGYFLVKHSHLYNKFIYSKSWNVLPFVDIINDISKKISEGIGMLKRTKTFVAKDTLGVPWRII